MALKTEHLDRVANQQFRIGRTVRRMAGLASLDLDRRMLVNEGSLFISVTLDTLLISGHRAAHVAR